MQKYYREILIIIFVAIIGFLLGRSSRNEQLLRQQDQIIQLNTMIQTTREALIRSKLSPQMINGFNQLGWNLPQSQRK